MEAILPVHIGGMELRYLPADAIHYLSGFGGEDGSVV
jgi:hypothetical protein